MSIPRAWQKLTPANNANLLDSQSQIDETGLKSPTIRREEPFLFCFCETLLICRHGEKP